MITIGRVLAPHGIRGEVRVEPLTDEPSRFSTLRRVYIADREYAIEGIRGLTGRPLVKLRSVSDPETAGSLRGKYIQIPEEESLPLPDGAYYHFQIIGLRVETTDGQPLGEVREIMPLEANDVYIVEGERGELLIPALKSVVAEINLSDGKLRVNAVPGLFPWDDPPR